MGVENSVQTVLTRPYLYTQRNKRFSKETGETSYCICSWLCKRASHIFVVCIIKWPVEYQITFIWYDVLKWLLQVNWQSLQGSIDKTTIHMEQGLKIDTPGLGYPTSFRDINFRIYIKKYCRKHVLFIMKYTLFHRYKC